MLPGYFNYIFVNLRQKARLGPELSPKFLLTLDSNLSLTLTRTKKPGQTYNCALRDVNIGVPQGSTLSSITVIYY